MNEAGSDLRERRARSPITLLAIVGGVGLAALLTVSLSLLKSTAPVGWTDGGQGPGPATVDVNIVRAVSGSGGKDVYFASSVRPGYFTTNFDLTNTTHWPVRVDGVTNSRTSKTINLTETTADNSTVTPLGSFWLQPGEQKYIGVQVVIPASAKCAPGETATWDTIELRLHYLWVVNDRARIELPFGLALQCGPLTPAYDPYG